MNIVSVEIRLLHLLEVFPASDSNCGYRCWKYSADFTGGTSDISFVAFSILLPNGPDCRRFFFGNDITFFKDEKYYSAFVQIAFLAKIFSFFCFDIR